MDFDQWEDESRPCWLTIKDLADSKVGDTFDVLMLDRNVLDVAEADLKHACTLAPNVFFQKNHHKLTLVSNDNTLTWKITWHPSVGCDEMTDLVHLYHPDLKTWYPLDEDGNWDITQEFDLIVPEDQHDTWRNKKIHWTDFPETTHVGWRGPVILWENILNMPDINYTPFDFEEYCKNHQSIMHLSIGQELTAEERERFKARNVKVIRNPRRFGDDDYDSADDTEEPL